MFVTYGLKLVMTGKESGYDMALQKAFERYKDGGDLIAVSLVDRYSVEDSRTKREYLILEVQDLPEGSEKVEK